ncbi:hypothetical protein [uncultured Sphaerochaeta sp.]|uniref:hypothetical protein n=1 Tax=uncultured Sphaerochaeta sp. TaxID=886478 RepID=UPI00263059F5|nr:hypothetical protein [uncultured Sphaerochaeta sp.]
MSKILTSRACIMDDKRTGTFLDRVAVAARVMNARSLYTLILTGSHPAAKEWKTNIDFFTHGVGEESMAAHIYDAESLSGGIDMPIVVGEACFVRKHLEAFNGWRGMIIADQCDQIPQFPLEDIIGSLKPMALLGLSERKVEPFIVRVIFSDSACSSISDHQR